MIKRLNYILHLGDAWCVLKRTASKDTNHFSTLGTNEKIDHLAIEKKWQDVWMARNEQTTYRDRAYFRPVPRLAKPLSCFYEPQLQNPITIIEVLRSSYYKIGARKVKKGHTMIDRAQELSNSTSTHLAALADTYGEDIFLGSLVFSHQAFDNIRIYDNGIDQNKTWFNLVNKAISSAREYYLITQERSQSSLPDIPSALYELDLETWHDCNATEYLQWTHEPLEEPMMIHFADDEAAYTKLHTVRNNALIVKRSLTQLTNTIISYNDAQHILPEIQYYATRVLLSLLAPSAPSFADDCWVRLHYGGETEWAQERPEFEETDLVEVEELIREYKEDTGKHNLLRRGRPETSKSNFDQPFPLLRKGKS